METSHLICRANQMTGFYMKCNTELTWVNLFPLVSNVRSTKSNYRVHCQRKRFGGICFGNLTNFTITKNKAATKQEKETYQICTQNVQRRVLWAL